MSDFQCLTKSAAQVTIIRCVGFTVTATMSLMMQCPGFCLQVNQNMCPCLKQESGLQSTMLLRDAAATLSHRTPKR